MNPSFPYQSFPSVPPNFQPTYEYRSYYPGNVPHPQSYPPLHNVQTFHSYPSSIPLPGQYHPHQPPIHDQRVQAYCNIQANHVHIAPQPTYPPYIHHVNYQTQPNFHPYSQAPFPAAGGHPGPHAAGPSSTQFDFPYGPPSTASLQSSLQPPAQPPHPVAFSEDQVGHELSCYDENENVECCPDQYNTYHVNAELWEEDIPEDVEVKSMCDGNCEGVTTPADEVVEFDDSASNREEPSPASPNDPGLQLLLLNEKRPQDTGLASLNDSKKVAFDESASKSEEPTPVPPHDSGLQLLLYEKFPQDTALASLDDSEEVEIDESASSIEESTPTSPHDSDYQLLLRGKCPEDTGLASFDDFDVRSRQSQSESWIEYWAMEASGLEGTDIPQHISNLRWVDPGPSVGHRTINSPTLVGTVIDFDDINGCGCLAEGRIGSPQQSYVSAPLPLPQPLVLPTTSFSTESGADVRTIAPQPASSDGPITLTSHERSPTEPPSTQGSPMINVRSPVPLEAMIGTSSTSSSSDSYIATPGPIPVVQQTPSSGSDVQHVSGLLEQVHAASVSTSEIQKSQLLPAPPTQDQCQCSLDTCESDSLRERHVDSTSEDCKSRVPVSEHNHRHCHQSPERSLDGSLARHDRASSNNTTTRRPHPSHNQTRLNPRCYNPRFANDASDSDSDGNYQPTTPGINVTLECGHTFTKFVMDQYVASWRRSTGYRGAKGSIPCQLCNHWFTFDIGNDDPYIGDHGMRREAFVIMGNPVHQR